MRGGRQDHRTRDPEVCEQHLAEVLIDDLGRAFLCDGQTGVFEGQSHHFGTAGIAAQNRHQRRMQRRDRQTQLPRKTEAVSGRARSGIGKSAGADDDTVKGIRTGVGFHTGDTCAVFILRCDKLGHRFMTDGDACIPTPPLQCRNDIMGIVGDGEHTASALGFDGDTEIFKQILRFLRRKAVDCAVEKPGIGRNGFNEVIGGAVIGDVAASLACDGELFSELRIFFVQRDIRTPEGSLGCRGHAGSTAADDSNSDVTHGITRSGLAVFGIHIVFVPDGFQLFKGF